MLFPAFEEVLQDLRGVGLEVVIGSDALVELRLPVGEGLPGLLELVDRALDVALLDADVELVGAFLDQLGELFPVFLEDGGALGDLGLGVDNFQFQIFLCHGGALLS